MPVTKPTILEAFQEVLRTLPLKHRRRLGTHLGVLAAACGVEFEQVSNLFQDQRELKEGGYLYHIHGTGGTSYFPMTLQSAAQILGLKPEYLRTRLALAEAKRGGKKAYYEPARLYPNESNGPNPERLSVCRTKKDPVLLSTRTPPEPAMSSTSSSEGPQQAPVGSGVSV